MKRTILFCLIIVALTKSITPAQAKCSISFGFDGLSVGCDVEDFIEFGKKIWRGVKRLFGFESDDDKARPKRVIYGRYERDQRRTSQRETVAFDTRPQAPRTVYLHPSLEVRYDRETYHDGDTLRLFYEMAGVNLIDGSRLPLSSTCSLIIEDGVDGRPDGAMRFAGCGFEGYALYYPVAYPSGQQLSVFVLGETQPVLVIQRRNDDIILLQQHSAAGTQAFNILLGGVS